MLYWFVAAAIITAYGFFFRKWMGGEKEQKLLMDYAILIGVAFLVGFFLI